MGGPMPGILLITSLDAATALDAASDVGRRLGFSVRRAGNGELSVQRGNLAASILFGAFIAYCDFHVAIEQNGKIIIERNSPWWTGFIGVSRVKSWAQGYADELQRAITDQGGKIINREEF